MQQEPQNVIRLAGCAHCKEKNPQNRCPCRSQYYCNRTCQRRDWARHKKDCGLFSKAGQDIEVVDLRSWFDQDQNGSAIVDGLREQLGLDHLKNREKLFDTFILIVLEFIPGSNSTDDQFSHSRNELFKISEVIAKGIRLDGIYYDIERVAKDIRAAQLKAKGSGRIPDLCGVLFTRFRPAGAMDSSYKAVVVEIGTFSVQKLTEPQNFRVYQGDPEKTSRLIGEQVRSPMLEELNEWLAIKAGDLSEIFTQEMNLFDDSNRFKINETACIINLDYDPSSSNLMDRFKVARLVGCFSFAELSSPPSFETDEWSLNVEAAIQGRAHRIRIQNLSPDHVLFCFIVLFPVEPWSLVTHIDGSKEAVEHVEPDPNWRERLLGE